MDLEALEAAARERLDPTFYDYIAGGAEDELTLADNVDAWSRLRLRPRVLRDVETVDLSTEVLGRWVSSPVGVAPMAMQHRACGEGAVATAEAAAATGSLLAMGLFGAGSAPRVAEVPSKAPRWIQVYVLKDRERSVAAIDRCVAQGYAAVVLTVDVVRQGNRRRDVRNQWTFLHEGDGRAENPNELFDRRLTFDDLGWFCERSRAPIVVKGVLRGDDAAQCVAVGAAGLLVSNHGGRQQDTAVATAEALREVVEAVEGRAEVYVDGGIRRGHHVVKALALGARAVFVGRPIMWGLAVAGRRGAEEVLRGYQDELERTMALCGVRHVGEITADLLAGAA